MRSLPIPATPRIPPRRYATLACLPVIDDITGQVCRRHRLSLPDAEDFKSQVRLHFIDRDCEVLGKFEGRSSVATYVTVIIQRLLLDYRNRMWGRWRSSANAKRLGPTAILLERLVGRDGWTFDQAVEMIRTNHGAAAANNLESLRPQVANRSARRQFVAEDAAAELESVDPPPDTNIVRAEKKFLAKRVHTTLKRARHALDAEERLILKMRFEDAVSVADIARVLHLDQKRLYRTIERLLARLRKSLEAEGVSHADVRWLFAAGVNE